MSYVLKAWRWSALLALALFVLQQAHLHAREPERERPVKRLILALYDGAQEGTAELTRIHRFAELPLNHLGYVLHYHDVRAGLPDPGQLFRFAGVLTWFVGPLAHGDAYLAWGAQAGGQGTRFIVLGDLGAHVTLGNLQLANRFMSLFGLRHTGEYVSPTDGSFVAHSDRRLYEYECRLDPVLPDYPGIEATTAMVQALFQLSMPDYAGKKLSILVAVGERGGFAAFNYEFCHQRAPLHRGKWLIDPFAFFAAALGHRPFPVPDTTTVSGRRIYFSLVDSSGWAEAIESDRASQTYQIAAETATAKLIEPFQDLAITLDLRERDIAKIGIDPARSRALVDRLLALPQVTRPGKRAIGLVSARYDAEYDSISTLAPLVTTGKPHVVLTAMGNELAYEGRSRLATALYSLAETLRRTELPRRLKPANINFHMRVGRNQAQLSILRRHLEAVRASSVAPVAASLYADIVDGFLSAEVVEVGARTWRVTRRGEMQTVRFDEADSSFVDMQGSRGVIGYSRHGGSLYVALDPAVDAAVIRLADAPGTAVNPADMELSDSRWRLRKLVREIDRLAFEAEGYGLGEFSWRLLPRIGCRVAARRGDVELWSAFFTADTNGRFSFIVPIPATSPVTIVVDNCKAGGAR